MDPLDERLLTLLVFEPERLPRNRNFHAFDEPAMQAVRRTARRLRHLRRALLAAEPDAITVRPLDDRVHVRIVDAGAAATHDAWVPRPHWDIIATDPRIAQLLGPATDAR